MAVVRGAPSGFVKVRGVEYSESDLIPGALVFRCSRQSATLQVSTCRQMWTVANKAGDRCSRCMGCPVGAAHAGVADPTASVLRGLPICSRCHRTELRLIGGNICVGCKNREYEWVKGRNAKGKPPVCHPPLARRRVTCRVGSEVRVVAREMTASTTELVVEMLRDSPTRVVFGLGVLHAA